MNAYIFGHRVFLFYLYTVRIFLWALYHYQMHKTDNKRFILKNIMRPSSGEKKADNKAIHLRLLHTQACLFRLTNSYITLFRHWKITVSFVHLMVLNCNGLIHKPTYNSAKPHSQNMMRNQMSYCWEICLRRFNQKIYIFRSMEVKA